MDVTYTILSTPPPPSSTHTHTDGGQYVCLESVKFPGQFVGILPDGTVKPPANTKTGLHGRFTVSALSPLQVRFKVQISPL